MATETGAEGAGAPHRETRYSLAYELEPGDLLTVNRKRLNQLRHRTETIIAVSGLGAAVFSWLTVMHGSGWIVILAGVFVLQLINSVRIMWRLNPRRYARRAWQRAFERHGRNLDIVEQAGVTSVMPDGSQSTIPWSAIDLLEETDDTFRLTDRDGVVRRVLLKRALPRPELVPALRDFINGSMAASRAATGPSPDGAVKQP